MNGWRGEVGDRELRRGRKEERCKDRQKEMGKRENKWTHGGWE